MKTKYTRGQIQRAISFWKTKLLAESLEPKTEAKLKEAAKEFAKAFAAQTKNGGVFRLEDEQTPDPIVAIKTTIKKSVSLENCKKEMKKQVPPELVDQYARMWTDWFTKLIFNGDKKAIDNLLKTTEQFNYFANVVFGIWHRDPTMSKFLKKNPPKDNPEGEGGGEDLSEGESFRANGNEDAAVEEDDILDGRPHNGHLDEAEDNLDIVIRLSKWVAWFAYANAVDEDPVGTPLHKLYQEWINLAEKSDNYIEEMIKFAEDHGYIVVGGTLPYSGEVLPIDKFFKMATGKDYLREGYDRFGGFGGYGRSYSSYGSRPPRGAEIGWFSVAQVDPACKDMDRNWRFGPIDFTRGVTDFLYPERKYKRGATMLRYKNFKMPDGGVVELYVGIASIFDAIKNNDAEALKKLEQIGINKNITLGLDPNDDFSGQYVLR